MDFNHNYNDRNFEATQQRRVEIMRQARQKRFNAKWCMIIGVPGLFFGIGFLLIPYALYLRFQAGKLEATYQE
jgi:hypothetical protein